MRDFVSILDPCITQAGNDALLKQVSDEKILDAIKSIGPLKASGSDGIHASFYQNCKQELKGTVIPMIKIFLAVVQILV